MPWTYAGFAADPSRLPKAVIPPVTEVVIPATIPPPPAVERRDNRSAVPSVPVPAAPAVEIKVEVVKDWYPSLEYPGWEMYGAKNADGAVVVEQWRMNFATFQRYCPTGTCPR